MNTILNERFIKLSKKKIIFLFFTGILSFIGGYFLWSLSDTDIRSLKVWFNDPFLVHTTGVAAIIFGLLGSLFCLYKIFDKKPGLILSSKGLTDNSSGIAVGFIPWSEILEFEIGEIQSTKYIVVKISNPAYYLNRGNALQRLTRKANLNLVGSPITISSSTLRIDFDELYKTILSYWNEFKHNIN